MKPYIARALERGLDARAVGLPVRKAEEVIGVYRAPGRRLRRRRHRWPFVWRSRGKPSRGARAARARWCCSATRFTGPAALTSCAVDHWPRISCPVLLLSGESDQFARIDLLRASVALLPEAHLFTWPGIGHGLTKVLDQALDRIAEFVGGLG